MKMYNFNNKKFKLIENSEKGETSSETIFYYKQNENLVTADYKGGTILYGKIIATIKNDELNMLYQCVTTNNELKSGKAIAKISKKDNRIELSLNWEWLNGDKSKGQSKYIEID